MQQKKNSWDEICDDEKSCNPIEQEKSKLSRQCVFLHMAKRSTEHLNYGIVKEATTGYYARCTSTFFAGSNTQSSNDKVKKRLSHADQKLFQGEMYRARPRRNQERRRDDRSLVQKLQIKGPANGRRHRKSDTKNEHMKILDHRRQGTAG